MEGTMVNLSGIMTLKEKYKFYLFVDEAHAIGAVGPNRRGVTDYYNIDPKPIGLLMGTFTRSFGAAGGYVAGKKAIIDRICVIASIMGVAVPTASTSNSSLTLRNNGSNGHLPVDDGYHHLGPVLAKILSGWMSLRPELAPGEEGTEAKELLARKGTPIYIGPRTGHAIWGGDVNELKSERWLGKTILESTGNGVKVSGIFSNVMRFFGGGQACPGMKFVLLEIKFVLFILIPYFEFEAVSEEIDRWTGPHLPLCLIRHGL
ncbi:serine palmitoyltransferase component [Marasmius sp. AFHP31]|nr:serine palmitoyltransferase component [Marasmius sp. AFHP31]